MEIAASGPGHFNDPHPQKPVHLLPKRGTAPHWRVVTQSIPRMVGSQKAQTARLIQAHTLRHSIICLQQRQLLSWSIPRPRSHGNHQYRCRGHIVDHGTDSSPSSSVHHSPAGDLSVIGIEMFTDLIKLDSSRPCLRRVRQCSCAGPIVDRRVFPSVSVSSTAVRSGKTRGIFSLASVWSPILPLRPVFPGAMAPARRWDKIEGINMYILPRSLDEAQ